MALREIPLSSLPTNSAKGRLRKTCCRNMSPKAMEEARKGSRYCDWSTNNGRKAMPTSGVSKAKKLKSGTAFRSVNLFDILADQDKENNPSNNIIQM